MPTTTEALGIYVRDMCEALDCYFTLEQHETTATYISAIADAEIDPEPVTSIDDLVDKINNDISGVTATRDSERPEVVHLVDDELASISGYAMDQEVTIDFSGTLAELIVELGQQLDDRIGPITLGGIGGVLHDWAHDDETEASVDVEDTSVRRIMTDAIADLEGYDRLIWMATTYLTNGDHHVEAGFSGPASWSEP